MKHLRVHVRVCAPVNEGQRVVLHIEDGDRCRDNRYRDDHQDRPQEEAAAFLCTQSDQWQKLAKYVQLVSAQRPVASQSRGTHRDRSSTVASPSDKR